MSNVPVVGQHDHSECVYHYCSIETFKVIIEKKTIRFSNVFKMNDYSEVTHVLNHLNECLRDEYKNRKENEGSFQCCYRGMEGEEALDKIVEDIKTDISKNRFQTYIACFSTEEDDLCQWRAYGDDGSGVAIGFDKKYLEHLKNEYNSSGHQMEYLEISYNQEELKDFLNRAIVDVIFRNLKGAATNGNVKNGFCTHETMVRTMNNSSITSILLAAAQFKYKAYMNEKEWRLHVSTNITDTWLQESINRYAVDEQHGTLIRKKMEFRNRGGKIISFFDLCFKDFPNAAELIKVIILGPKSRMNKDDFDLQMFLRVNGFNIESWNICESRIPYS